MALNKKKRKETDIHDKKTQRYKRMIERHKKHNEKKMKAKDKKKSTKKKSTKKTSNKK